MNEDGVNLPTWLQSVVREEWIVKYLRAMGFSRIMDSVCNPSTSGFCRRHIIDTLAPREEYIGKLLLKELKVVIPSENLRGVEFVDFCNALIEYWKIYLGELISHSSYVSMMMTDDKVSQPMRDNEREEEEDLEEDPNQDLDEESL
ncbi:hypothetical protein Fot_22644 [Forsythia ovata]|uniref:Uncharacterized protein n=1 Tax=Forsythia ovata TaxID=205694 RepID=A0ABD1V0A5_9LAMI